MSTTELEASRRRAEERVAIHEAQLEAAMHDLARSARETFDPRERIAHRPLAWLASAALLGLALAIGKGARADGTGTRRRLG